MNIYNQDRYSLVILSAAKNPTRHAEILRCAQNDSPDSLVILSAAKNLTCHAEILRCAQNDSPDFDR